MPRDATARAMADADIDALVLASRAFVGIALASLAGLADRISLGQFRALVVLTEAGTLRSTELAEQLGVVASSVTRMCDRLVADGLVRRSENPRNRREVLLSATRPGRRLVDQALNRRRELIGQVLDDIDPAERASLVAAFGTFVAHVDPRTTAQVLHEWPVS
jgi:DNA-binding MarR family transcriptional regulator